MRRQVPLVEDATEVSGHGAVGVVVGVVVGDATQAEEDDGASPVGRHATAGEADPDAVWPAGRRPHVAGDAARHALGQDGADPPAALVVQRRHQFLPGVPRRRHLETAHSFLGSAITWKKEFLSWVPSMAWRMIAH